MAEKSFVNGYKNTYTSDCLLMKNVYETSFALDDLGLYINTHPYDNEAKEAYASMKLSEETAEESYMNDTKRPIKQSDCTKPNMNNWTDKPWPWEGVY